VRGSRLPAIAGAIPRLDALPDGCRFHPRCPLADARCATRTPALQDLGQRSAACWHAFEPDAGRTVAEPRVQVQARQRPAAHHPLADGVAPGAPLVEAMAVSKHFASGRGLLARGARVHALDEVSLHVQRGETFGLVGESGCGKSTLGRVLLQLETPSAGEVRFAGRPLQRLSGSERRLARREMQIIFQDPYSAIDPRWTVGEVIAEPLRAFGVGDAAGRRERVDELLGLVGLSPSVQGRPVHEFSGGQRQRIGIARAIALDPSFVLADEAVSALDLSVQAQVINLLADLRERLSLTTLFIGHGLNVVRHLSHRIGVMYLGRLVEVAPAEALFAHPAHHYTQALIAAIPLPDPARRREWRPPIGELPSPTAPPPGCHFHPRCPAATARCRSEPPILTTVASGRQVACHFPRS
jgi:oligopeptide/dipeptide ABC transporter ATP-binding protein